ncbi:MAG: helix-turn-helix transcriptional regulator [Actinomycetota bacterium]
MPAERTTERLRRILVLVPWVIAHPETTVTELCERFGISREELASDVDVLMMCGLPPFGPGDLIEAFIEGDEITIGMADYLAKPPRLTRGEAIALLVTGRAVAALPGMEEAESLRNALGKLASAVSPGESERANELADRIAVELGSAGDDLLAGLRRAVDERTRLRINYYSSGRDVMTEREIDPLLVCASLGYWYLVAQDQLSGEERTFRVDRIRDAKPTGETFEQPDGFDASKYRDGPFFAPSPRDLVVTLELRPGAAWMREVVPHDRADERADGLVRMDLRTSHFAWLVRLLLSAGDDARVVGPDELRVAVRDAAARALARYAPA